jgi:RNA polymerase sporulation-specific sigma factor
LKTFPKPLTAEEEKLYLKRYKEGDMEARRILIERNLRLVAHVAKKYQGPDEDSDDLISIGTIGLIKAVSTFDHSKNNRLATYAARCIDNELLMMLRMRKKTSKEVSLYEPIGMDKEGNEISLLDIIEGANVDIAEIMDLEADTRRLYEILQMALTEREREVLKLRYGLFGENETTQREIARELGISRSYVSRIEKKTLEKLREEFEKNG